MLGVSSGLGAELESVCEGNSSDTGQLSNIRLPMAGAKPEGVSLRKRVNSGLVLAMFI